MIKEEKINHRKAKLRVSGNIDKLRNSPQTLKSVYEIIFSRPNFTYLNVINDYGYDEISYQKAKKHINYFAKYFDENITRESNYVGILMENSKEWIYSFFGLLVAGFRPVLFSTANELSDVKHVKEKLNITHILVDKETSIDGVNFVKPKDIKCEGKEVEVQREFSDEIVFLSSGTTGVPKIVFYKGEQICSQIYNAYGVLRDSKIIDKTTDGYFKHLVVLPFYHIFGLFAVLLWFSFFNVTFVLPTQINPKAIKQACFYARPTHIFAVPVFYESIYSMMMAKVDTDKKKKKLKRAFKLSYLLQKTFGGYGTHLVRDRLLKKYLNQIFGTSIRFCISGGAFLNPETLKTINLLGYPLVNGYGSTEIGITSLADSNSISKRISTSIGKPLDSVKYKVENGSLLVNAPSSAKRVINVDKEEIYKDEDFINTHDSVKEENGEYFLLGREDEIVVKENGENLSLPLLEKQIFLPSAKEFALVNDGAKLCLVANYNRLTSIKTVISELSNVGDSPVGKHISGIYYTITDLPKANSIKIKRSELLNMLKNDRDNFASLKVLKANTKEVETFINKQTLRAVIEAYKTIFPNAEVNASSHFYNDLGGDSLKYFVLVSEVENKIGRELKLDYENPPYSPEDFVKVIEQ